MASVQIIGKQFGTMLRSVQLCCEEKKVSYEIINHFKNQEVKVGSLELARLHPFMKFPVLVHEGHILYETAPICRYIDDCFPGTRLQPESALARAIVDQWSQVISIYVDQTIIRSYVLEFAFPKGANGEIRWQVVEEVQPRVKEVLAILANQLSKTEYIAGSRYSIADALLTPILDYLSQLPTAEALLTDGALTNYLGAMQARENAQSVLIKTR